MNYLYIFRNKKLIMKPGPNLSAANYAISAKYETTPPKEVSSALDRKAILEQYTVVQNRFADVIAQCSSIQKELLNVAAMQQALQESLGSVRRETKTLEDTVNKVNLRQGVAKLLKLWRLLSAPGNCLETKNDAALGELSDALREFGVTSFYPKPGDIYDPEFHIKEDSSDPSNVIVSCSPGHCGWYMDGKILEKAVVRTRGE